MAFNPGGGALDLDVNGGALPIFDVERVQLQFSVAGDFVCGQAANNVLILAISTGRILRIDLNKSEDIDGTFWTLLVRVRAVR
jgi:vacuolar protein sorting-associated protein 18